MNLEGLQAILNKEEVIITRQARDFLERPKAVEDAYKNHVRSYIPIHSNVHGQLSIEGFVKRFLERLQAGRVPRGYITADFGYGKTSTGLYLWQQATAAGFLAIPPFQLSSLIDFLHATAGWIRYALGHAKPSLQAHAESIYAVYMNQSIETVASRYNISIASAQRMIADKPQLLDLTPPEIVRFLRQMTNLAIEAGSAGLLIIADEVQQYLEPEIKAGKRDPIGPLFELINELGAQSNLSVGLMLLVPQKEIGVINDQRGDLIDRMRPDALDLKTVYDQNFPQRLWGHWAKAFQYQTHASQIITLETLRSLGEISLRTDLANGPRTVINALRRSIQLYLDRQMPSNQPYTPIDLIDDFLNGAIAFDGTKRISEVVGRLLNHPFVLDNEACIPAIKLAAAFPTEGASTEIQELFGLSSAFTLLREQLYGELVTTGPNLAAAGTRLLGLELAQLEQNWLTTAIREFSRNYTETSDLAQRRALDGFKALLKMVIFKNGWQERQNFPAGIALNAGMSFEGAFASFKRDFPERVVQIAIMLDDEIDFPVDGEFDLLMIVRLCRYWELDAATRSKQVTTPSVDGMKHTIHLTVNLVRQIPGLIHHAVEKSLITGVAAERLTPLFLLAFHAYLEDLMVQSRVPKPEQPFLTTQFMPALLESVVAMIFDRDVGAPFDSAGVRLIEILVEQGLRTRYGTHYHTLMVTATWRNLLRDYSNMLTRLDAPGQKQGYLSLRGHKEQIARQLNLTNTALDNFIATWPDLIEIIQDFKRSRSGEIRFKLHPLEERILVWLASAPVMPSTTGPSLHHLATTTITNRAKLLGYKADETEQIISVIRERGLVEQDKLGNVVESLPPPLTIEQLTEELKIMTEKGQLLQALFPENHQGQQVIADIADLAAQIDHLQHTGNVSVNRHLLPLEAQLHSLSKVIEVLSQSFVTQTKRELQLLLEQIEGVSLPGLELLNIPTQGGPYIQALRILRASLLEKFKHVQASVSTTRIGLQEIQTRLSQPYETLGMLAQVLGDVQRYTKQCAEICLEAPNLLKYFIGYRAWVNAAQLYNEGISRLNQLGHSNSRIRHQLETLESAMASCLADTSKSVYIQGESYESQLKYLLSEITEHEMDVRNKFIALQDAYLEILRRACCPADRLWDNIVYSQSDSEKVYAQLYTNVGRATIATLDHIEDEIQRLCSELRQKQAASQETVTSEISTIVLDELGLLLQKIPFGIANDNEVIKSFDGRQSHAFARMLQDIQAIWHEIENYQTRITAIQFSTQKIQLISDEIVIIEKIQGGMLVNLADLWESLLPLSVEQIWASIRTLWEGGRISIKIQKR